MHRLSCVLAAAVAGSAFGQVIVLNPGIEDNPGTSEFGDIAEWGPNGGWAFHTNFQKPGHELLGERFGFYSSGNGELVGQLLSATYAEGVEYTFSAFLWGGGNDQGVARLSIGYLDNEADPLSFVALSSADHDTANFTAWTQSSVSVVADASAAGRRIFIAFDRIDQPNDDIWFDQISVVPTPGAAALLAAGGLLAGRRRR